MSFIWKEFFLIFLSFFCRNLRFFRKIGKYYGQWHEEEIIEVYWKYNNYIKTVWSYGQFRSNTAIMVCNCILFLVFSSETSIRNAETLIADQNERLLNKVFACSWNELSTSKQIELLKFPLICQNSAEFKSMELFN